MLYRRRDGGNNWLLELNRLEALLTLRYLASAPGAAEINLPLPFVSPPRLRLDDDPWDDRDGGGVSEWLGPWFGRGMPTGPGEDEKPNPL